MWLSSWKQNNYNRTESPCIFLSTKMVDLFPFFMCLLLKEKKRQNMKCMKLTQPRWLSRVKHAKMLKSLFISLAAHCQLLCRNKGPQSPPTLCCYTATTGSICFCISHQQPSGLLSFLSNIQRKKGGLGGGSVKQDDFLSDQKKHWVLITDMFSQFKQFV